MLTTFWSSWIVFITVMCLIVLVTLIVVVLRMKVHLAPDGTTGVDYGGIKEYDKPIPRWWLISFWLTIVWAITYLVLYPGLGTYKGAVVIKQPNGTKTSWTSANEVNKELAENQAVFSENYNKYFGNMNVDQLSKNPTALKIGQGLFEQNCALCHGVNARGSFGFPNLTDKDWLYGGSTSAIHTSIAKGRQGVMAAWQEKLGEDGVQNVAEYVLSLSHRKNLNTTKVQAGAAIFATNCTVCHGADGKGNQQIGAPNLTDNIWLYAHNSRSTTRLRADVQDTIRNGRNGKMPAWQDILGNERTNLLTAYVYSLSN